MALPTDGQLNWGDQLNAEITSDETNITTVTNNYTNHSNNVPPDPHQDRAFASALVAPITTGVNGPNGYVRLDGTGHIPLSLVPVGAGLTNWVDAIPDFNVPTNGLSDASATLNAALTQANQNNGGVVYVGNGTFALAKPLSMPANTWLICSPGAIFTRLNLITPPFAMVQNYGNGIVPPNGNIRVTGGTWNIATLPGHSGTMFSFVAGNFILVEDLTVVGYPDGNSPIGQLFGCNDVILDNIQIQSAAPINTGRSNQHKPCFQVEECNSTNIPNLPASIYSNQECQDVRVRGCSLRGGTLNDDNLGNYTAWSSFCGTKGTITSGNTHNNIVIEGGCFSSGHAVAAVEVLNWNTLSCIGNFFSYPQNPFVSSWSPTGLQTTLIQSLVFDTNTPRAYSPSVATCTTIAETIVCQFTIPPNDWRIPVLDTDGDGSCYKHHHSGFLTCASNATLTIKIYVGTDGRGPGFDTLCETVTITGMPTCSNTPYAFHHKGFDIDHDGGWIPCGTEFTCNGKQFWSHGTTKPTPTPGKQCYVTHTVSWDSNSGRSCQTKRGHHEKHKQ